MNLNRPLITPAPGIRVLILCMLGVLFGSVSGPAAHAEQTKVKRGPVVLVVLEELPLSSLLRADGEIDEIWYPAFAELAGHSTWVRNHTAMSHRSLDSVPAILSGRVPSETRLWPVYSSYPNNLFTLMKPTHKMHVVETQSRMRPPPGVGPDKPYRWEGDEDPQIGQVRTLHKDGKRPLDEPTVLRRFARDIVTTHARTRPPRGSFHFLHVMFPMSPWRYTPTGERYFPYRIYGNFGTMWADEPWWPEEAFRRHLLQVRFTDRLLADLVAQLRKGGIYDRTLLIVTASHGAGFWPGDSMLTASRMTHPEDLMSVPLFIKRPGQREPDRLNTPSEAMDLLPTIADLLDIEVSFEVDGCSIFDESCPARESRRVLVLSEQNRRSIQEFPLDVVSRSASLERRIRLLGTGAEHARFYRFGPYAGLCGRSTESLAKAPSAGSVKIHRRGTQWKEGRSGVRFEGVLLLEDGDAVGDETPHIAIALDGRIEMVVPAPIARRKRRVVSAILPEESVASGREAITIFLVTGDPNTPKLAPLAIQ